VPLAQLLDKMSLAQVEAVVAQVMLALMVQGLQVEQAAIPMSKVLRKVTH